MDVFKLLSRSTNLARKRPADAHPATSKPSAGAATNPQLFGVRDSQDTIATRNQPNGQQNGVATYNKAEKKSEAVPKEIDFFNKEISTRTIQPHDIAEHPSKNTAQDDSITRHDQLSENLPQSRELSEDDCRRILKSHKIKITQIWTPTPLSQESADMKKQSKKRKREMIGARGLMSEEKQKKQRLDLVPQPLQSLDELRPRFGLSRRLAENIEDQGYRVPTEVQLAGLPLLLKAEAIREESTSAPGKRVPVEIGTDLLTVAPTGSGKTLAFLIPILNATLKDRASSDGAGAGSSGPKAIIIAPTKELASQIVNEGRKLSLRTKVKITLVRKGMAFHKASSRSTGVHENGAMATSNEAEGDPHNDVPVVGADILVSTPLTLLHTMIGVDESLQTLPSVRFLVLDEADVLLDDLFRAQTLQLWAACTNPLLRVSLWSATMGASIEDLARATIEERWQKILSGRYDVVERAPLVRLVVGLKDSAIPNIQHKLVYAATEQGKLMALRQLLRPTTAAIDNMPRLLPPFLVFVQTISRAIALHSELLYEIPQEAGGSSRIAVLHADLSDTARELVMTRFRKGEIWVLITTDLLSRGVDFRGVNGVVNYDFPNSSAAYVHRVGRTGRAGREGGVAITLYAKEDIPFVKNVANVIAAAERQKGGKENTGGIQPWLLDAMPKPSKRDKQRLKKRGIESRRTDVASEQHGRDTNKTRISTKSGYERKLQNNRRGAVQATQQLADQETEDDFAGFSDQ